MKEGEGKKTKKGHLGSKQQNQQEGGEEEQKGGTQGKQSQHQA